MHRYRQVRHSRYRQVRHSQWGQWFVLLVFGLAVVVAFFLVNSGTIQATGVKNLANQKPLPFRSQRTPMAVVGSPAIKPHLTTNSSPSSASSTAEKPTFLASDASAYVTTHPMWRNLAAWATPTVVKVAFLTSKQVSALLGGESTGMPDNALLCFVELRGSFSFAGPTGVTVTYSTGFEVFDAHSGNFLMSGGLHSISGG